MTANISQNVLPRQRADFRSSLKYVPARRHTFSHTSAAKPLISNNVAFRVTSIGRQLGSIDHNTLTLSLGLLALISVAMLGFFYLQQVIGTASQGTDINTLENQISDLKQQQRQLEVQGAQLRSLKNIEGTVQKLNLVGTDKVSYLSATTDKVALGNATPGVTIK